jgi:VIT1/CCC1 family predicted Fe2+/Mn2+ transporter
VGEEEDAGAGSKLDNARELRKVVYFSNIVLAPLVAATKGGSAEEKKEKALQEMASLMAEARKKEEEAAAAEPEGTFPVATYDRVSCNFA